MLWKTPTEEPVLAWKKISGVGRQAPMPHNVLPPN